MKNSNLTQLIIGVLLTSCYVFVPALAAVDKCSKKLDISCTYSPKPAADDFSLPMPKIARLGEMQMVFRKVTVPGSEFWGNPERLVRVGDSRAETDNFFEGIQRLPIAGVFYDRKAGNWFYYLGKYEVTIAQYVAVMGDGDEKKGLAHFYAATGDKKQVKKLKKASKKGKLRELAKPLTRVTWQTFQAFIHKYNMWCYAAAQCFAKLPRLPKKDWKARIDKERDSPSFFRLPTELEWEYAARGGYTALKTEKGGRPLFEKSLPFPESQLKKYAWTKPHSYKGVTRIGRWKDTYGFYDLFGNVQELTSHWFVTEMSQGKVGALSARGGSFMDQARTIRSSFRREVEIYQPRQTRDGKITAIIESRSPTTGIRLAMGALVSPSPRFSDNIKAEYDSYEKGFRMKTAAGKSTGDALVRGSEGLKDAYLTIEALKKRDAELSESSSEIRLLQKSLVSADKQIQEGIRQVCAYMTEVGLFRLTAGGYSYAASRKYHTFLNRNKEEAAVSTVMRRKIRNVKQNLAEAEKRYNDHFAAYIKTLRKLGGYPTEYVNNAVKRLTSDKSGDKKALQFLTLMKQHLKQASRRVSKPDLWIAQAQKLALRVYVVR